MKSQYWHVILECFVSRHLVKLLDDFRVNVRVEHHWCPCPRCTGLEERLRQVHDILHQLKHDLHLWPGYRGQCKVYDLLQILKHDLNRWPHYKGQCKVHDLLHQLKHDLHLWPRYRCQCKVYNLLQILTHDLHLDPTTEVSISFMKTATNFYPQ